MEITQYKVSRVLANEEVEAKIKLRNESYNNLLKHRVNIPYASGINAKPLMSFDVIIGGNKPINVNEEKMKNIRKNTTSLIMEAIENNQLVIANDDIKYSNADESSNSLVDSSNDDVVLNNNIIDINDYMAKINNETELVKNIRKEAMTAQAEAKESDENVNQLSMAIGELEKQAAQVEAQNLELDHQLAEAYESQIRTLVLLRKESEDLIQEANKRKQENENKILQFQSRADDIRSHINDENESIARKQEILPALQQTEFTDMDQLAAYSNFAEDGFSYDSTENFEEDSIKRIA